MAYLREHALRLTTAESCTAGMIVTLLSEIEGSGALIESGYVVYSPEAKQRLLRVSPRIIEAFGLTSCEVARDMALARYGAWRLARQHRQCCVGHDRTSRAG